MTPEQQSPIGRLIRFSLENRLLVTLFIGAIILAGVLVAPFEWKVGGLQRYPVPVDAIPDIGENQQIVFTQWMGRSPQDVEDQISYPLTVSLLGIPGVKIVRSYSMFGFSSIYIIFKENVEFYWSRTRVLEKLNSLPAGTLPPMVQPTLGPDATALGQIYWYTLEGRDPDGNPTGGWDQEELRTIQDWHARYALLSADGVAEVGSIGGYVKEYQVDVDPDAMRAYGVTLDEVFNAVRGANVDVGAKTLELNRVEYFIRGVGFIKGLEDIRQSVVKVAADNVPVLIDHVANVTMGPASRRGALDKGGAPVVGGVVVARYGDNPLAVINNVKAKIAQTAQALPRKTLADGTLSQVTVVPFYDRSGLIHETLGTLNAAIGQQVLVTILVVLVMVLHLRSGLVISSMLPLTVLLCFVGMKLFKVQANIVALSGIAIAIGTIVDMGIVICENILKHLAHADPSESRLEVVHRAASEVGGAVLTAVLTTVISFLPVFTMIGAEGKLFKPLAFTKTFALVASIIIALTILPVLAHTFFVKRERPKAQALWLRYLPIILTCAVVAVCLAAYWAPLGGQGGLLKNLLFVVILVGGLLGFFRLFQHFYARILGWCLDHKGRFLLIPAFLLLFGLTSWLGFGQVFGWLPDAIQKTAPVQKVAHWFPGFGKEFMPSLDEGSFLWMPTTMTHASIGEALDVLQKQDMAFEAIPEVESVVGKLGRAETPLDPAPISMIETVINYKPEYGTDDDGNKVRQWRDHIRTPNDIWDEIVKAGRLPGTTSAPKLQPIAARIVMLQSGMRAPMGIKVTGPDLDTIERVGLQIEQFLKEVPSVEPAAVIADRIVGKPYLEIHPDRNALARYGIPIRKFQDVVEIAIGGRQITTTVEGRERFPVRVRYQRERRDSIEAIDRILVPGAGGQQIPIMELAEIRYVRGPQTIKSEDTFLVGYVVFDKKDGYAEVDVVEQCQAYLQSKTDSGELSLPRGVSYRFTGSYENQVRASKTLALVLPLALVLIFVIIYFHFKSIATTALIFTGVFVAWCGGFILMWFYAQPWFLDFSLFGVAMRDLFQIHTINLSVAVWVGFLALFGIATDDGVVMGTYLTQLTRERKPATREAIRATVLEAGERRVRACLMTTATTILALLPVLTSVGRGSDVMVPMAIPSFGGMLIEVITMLVVPVLYCWLQEIRLGRLSREAR
ncbi:MAG: efflux RND transporter permease subunit [Verrucomicrobia bacterium]|nr:efflux RND transporter permease subunit [Verrucomicrobiota bacterium]